MEDHNSRESGGKEKDGEDDNAKQSSTTLSQTRVIHNPYKRTRTRNERNDTEEENEIESVPAANVTPDNKRGKTRQKNVTTTTCKACKAALVDNLDQELCETCIQALIFIADDDDDDPSVENDANHEHHEDDNVPIDRDEINARNDQDEHLTDHEEENFIIQIRIDSCSNDLLEKFNGMEKSGEDPTLHFCNDDSLEVEGVIMEVSSSSTPRSQATADNAATASIMAVATVTKVDEINATTCFCMDCGTPTDFPWMKRCNDCYYEHAKTQDRLELLRHKDVKRSSRKPFVCYECGGKVDKSWSNYCDFCYPRTMETRKRRIFGTPPDKKSRRHS